MGDPQKTVAAWIGMVFVTIPALFFLWVALATFGDGPLGDNWPGGFFLNIMKGSDAAVTALKTLLLLITFGLSFIIPKKKKADIRFYLVVILALIGLLSCLYLYFAFQGSELSHRMWSYSEVDGLDSPDGFADSVLPKLLGITAWFGGIIAAQVGMTFKGGPP